MIADLKPYAEYKESGLPWLGQVPGHWAVTKLKHVFNRIDRPSDGKQKAKPGQDECPVVPPITPSARVMFAL